jgi:hypothetical protein
VFTFFGLFTDPVPGLQDQLLERWPSIDITVMASPFPGIAARFPADSYEPANEDLPASVTAETVRISASHPGVRFLLLRTECWGGDCFNWGQLIRDGQLVYETEGKEALRRLVGQYGVDIGAREIFQPLSRDFPWKVGVAASDSRH